MFSNSPILQIFAILFLFGQFFIFANSLPTPTTVPSTIVSLLNSSQNVLDLTDNYSVAAFWEAKNCSNQTEDDPRVRFLGFYAIFRVKAFKYSLVEYFMSIST